MEEEKKPEDNENGAEDEAGEKAGKNAKRSRLNLWIGGFLLLMLLASIWLCVEYSRNSAGSGIYGDNSTIEASKCAGLGDIAFIYKEGCPHCEKTMPVIMQIEKENNLSVEYYNLDIEENLTYLQEMSIIPRGVPALIVDCRVYLGHRDKSEIEKILETLK